MRAVVFDLFGTLTDPAAEVARESVVAATADALGVDRAVFWAAMSTSFADRITGRWGGTTQTLASLSAACGAPGTPDALTTAVRIHLAGVERLRAPREGALGVLAELRRRGFRIGLVSDCSSEVAEGWAASPYADLIDARVLSYEEQCRKPDARLYAAVTARLGVQPEDCWYVGDGGGRELTGASAAGMTPVLVTNAAVPEASSHREDPDTFAAHHTVDDLDGLLEVVGWPA